ncbi:MAG: hypothetical protein M3P85_12780 [Actinomycetota bacterium]|nr:hypothetical protein [Actinomycetota bacterium]
MGDGDECASAVSRLEREDALTGREATPALGRLQDFKAGWHEVQPVETVRRTAGRLVTSEGDPAPMELVTLAEAAEREGLVIVETEPSS